MVLRLSLGVLSSLFALFLVFPAASLADDYTVDLNFPARDGNILVIDSFHTIKRSDVDITRINAVEGLERALKEQTRATEELRRNLATLTRDMESLRRESDALKRKVVSLERFAQKLC